MRYEDASQAGSITTGSEPVARPDVETLPPSSNGPGSGNAISGMGTNSGASGADQVADGPAVIIELRGALGAGASNGNGFEAAGQYGTLSMDPNGNFNYVRTTPADGVQDIFQYTLADAKGARSSTTLTVEIPRVIDEQAMVNLPAGVQMSDIRVVGRDLVIKMPDGSEMVIPGGAVFVPELSIGDVIIPPTNLAALLIDSEPQPAAGPPQSSGGNFADDVPDLDPGVPLGDLIPPTEVDYTPPDYEEPMELEDREPTIIIFTPDNPAGAVNATASVDESGLPERGSEPEGTLESQNIETTTGTVRFTAEDGLEAITINDVAITAVGQQIQGEHGVLTITSINLETGEVGYSYTATDNTTDGVDDFEDFIVVVTDEDGDTATGSLHIDILDDEPLAEDDVDTVNLQANSATGNVMTGIGTNAGVASADTVGADNATLTAVAGEGGSDATFDGNGNLVVDGEFGTLTIDAEGNYTYVPFADAPGGTEDVFTYTLTDGDGDVITATLTIINPDQTPTAGTNPVVQLDDDVLGGNPGGTNDDPNSVNATGTLSGSGGDGQLTFDLLTTGAPEGFTYVDGPDGSILVQQVQDGVTVTVLTITVDPETGAYTVVQNANILHPEGQTENNVVFTINYTVTDGDGDVATSSLTINVDDDTPLANDDTETMTENETQETGNVITGAGTNEGTSNADSPGADGFAGIVGLEGANGTDTNPSGGFTVQGEFGSLVMDADGNYTYTRDPNILEGGEDVFTYTYVDGDGDTVTATLTILVPDIDLVPVANPPANVIVDDDNVGNAGNPGGVGDDDPQNATGTLTATGGNGDSDFFFDVTATANGLPAGFSLGAGSTTTSLLIMQGATLVMTVTLNSETGQYTVVQNAPIDHAAGGDENNVDFDIIFNAIDQDGSVSADQTLSISVDDDTPEATDDSNSIATGQFGPVTGNVIDNDSPGADGFGKVTLIVSDGTGASDNAADGSGDYQVQGDYGVLTINEDGSYSYLRDAGTPGGVSDSFTYTYIDSDGDPVTAVLTITIGDATPVADEPDAVIVDDDDVGSDGNAGGTDDDTPQNETGTLTATGGDGDIDFAFDVTATANGLPAGFSLGAGSTTTSLLIMQGATLVMTVTLNAETGAYTVVQNAPIVHADGSDENNVDFDIIFNAIDEDGSVSADQTLSISVDDDTPEATDDSNSIATGQFGPVTGNVIDNDSPGADGFGKVTLIVSDGTGASDNAADGSGDYQVQGDYGVLTINEDGSYSYLRDAGTPGGVSDSFTYTYIDSDGDPVTAVLTITIGDATPVADEPDAVIVDDDDVGSDGNAGGTDDDTPQNETGTLTATGGDGDIDFAFDVTATANGLPAGFSLGAGSTTTSLLIMQGATLVMTVTLNAETGPYTVVQNAPIDHAAGGDENNVDFDIIFNAIDEDGSVSADQTLSISVDDDTPEATDDSNSIATGQFGPVTGNVIDNDSPGADGFGKVTLIVSDGTGASDNAADGSGDYQVQGDYGVLTINEDGSYSYLRDAGTPGGVSDSFTYTYIDSDGDPVTAVLTITIGDATPVADEPDAVIVDDDDVGSDGNAGGTDDDTPQNETGTLTATGGDGDIDFAFDVTATANGLPAGFSLGAGSTTTSLLIMQGATLVMTVTLNAETGAYTVVQNAPIVHADGSDENNVDFDIIFNAIDEDGSVSADQTLSISVDDDTPEATDDSNSIATGQFGPVTGNVIDNDSPGADGFGKVTLIVSDGTGASDNAADGSGDYQVQGDYGVLTINEDGSYSYLRDAGTPGGVSDSFTYTYIDSDGDPVTAVLTITIGDATPVADEPDAVIVDDDDVGSDGNAGGTDDDTPQNETGTLTATGGDGDIDFAFDVTATANGLPAGFSLGAGSTTTSLLIMQGATLVMTVTLNAETGAYTVVQNAPIVHADGSDENNVDFDIIFNAIDEDGSVSADQTLSISVDDDTPAVTSPGLGSGSVTVDETGPVAGGAPAPIALTDGVDTYVAGNDEDELGAGRIASGTSTGGLLATATISFGADGPLGGNADAATTYALQIAVDGASGVTTTEGEAITLVQLDNGIVLGIVQGTGEHAGQVAFAISINADTGALQVDQYLSLDHPTNPNPNEPISLGTGALSVVVSATDGDGDTTSSTAVDISTRVTFLDDGPSLGAFTDSNIPNVAGAYNGTYAYDWGADGLGALTVTGPVIEGIDYDTETLPDGTVILTGYVDDGDGVFDAQDTEVFNLEVRPDGTYTFNLVTPDAADDITYPLDNLESGNADFAETFDGRVEFSPLDKDGNDTGTVNVSNAGFGVGNQFTGNGEAFTLEFHTPGEAGDQAVGTNPDFVDSVAFTVPANGVNGDTVTLTWYAYNTVTNQMDTGVIVVTDGAVDQQIVIDPDIPFNVLVVEASNADGQGVRLTELTVSQTILPQDQDFDFTIQATDGDGDPTGTSTLSVNIDADAPPPAPLMATQETQETASADMSATLVASNDNTDSARAFTAGNQAALMGVIAAAGLEMSGKVADVRATVDDNLGESLSGEGGITASLVNVEGDGGQAGTGSLAALDAPDPAVSELADGPASNASAEVGRAELDAANDDAGPAVSALAEGTQSSSAGEASAMTASAVAMPSMEMVAALEATSQSVAASDAASVAQNQEVGRVLADALAGGNGPDIGALVEALGGAGSQSAFDALASVKAGGVSFGHNEGGWAFANGHPVFSMDAVALHHDATPA